MSVSLPRPGKRAEPDRAARQDAHRLAALALESAVTGVQRRCLLLRLSRLPSALTRSHHIRLAAEALDPLLSADRAQRFLLPNRDIAVVWRGAADLLLSACRAAVMAMFADAEVELPPMDLLWMVVDLPVEAEPLRELALASLADPASIGLGAEPGVPLDAAALAALEIALVHADVARFARRRTVCARDEDGVFRTGWEVRRLALDELCAELTPGRDARAEPWLHRRLVRTLDRRLLTLLATSGELRAAGPFGLELAVDSVLSAEFIRFDAALPQPLRAQVVLGLEPADIFGDMPAFLFARDFARVRGYRLLLRLPASSLLAALPAAQLGLDLAELPWSSAAMALPTDLLDSEADRLVLVGADGRDAVAWGRANGIRWFEGAAVAPGRASAALALAVR